MARQTVMTSALPTAPMPEVEEQFRPDLVEGWTEDAAGMDWRAAFGETMAMDPEIQVAGEEDADLPQNIRDKMNVISPDIRLMSGRLTIHWAMCTETRC